MCLPKLLYFLCDQWAHVRVTAYIFTWLLLCCGFIIFFHKIYVLKYSTITSADIRVLLGDQDVKGVMSKLSTWLWNKIILYSSRSVFFSKHLLVEGMRARINYSLWRQEFGGFFIMTKDMPVQKVKNKRLV